MQNFYQEPRICRFYVQGKCKFGNHCKFSHDVLKIYVMRHGESRYNKMVSESTVDFSSEQAMKLYQLNPDYVDASLTQKTFQQQFITFPPSLNSGKGSYEVDVILVSPMRRTLQTTKRLLERQNLKAKKILVLPWLTEVFSKICDISGPMEEKMKQFPLFDFSMVFSKFPKGSINWWQDELVDPDYRHLIKKQMLGYQRYKQILEKVFPESMESYERCLERTLKCLGQIKKMSKQRKWSRIFVVSHNRILKYTVGVLGRELGSLPIRLANCQIREAYI